jgi:hypothetical protein
MKKIFLIFFSVLLLTACGGGNTASVIDGSGDSARPKIPQKKPSVPVTNNLQANALGVTEVPQPPPEPDMKQLIERININISQPNISVQDIERGWYLGGETDKRDGTPSTWTWVDKGKDSAWVSPSFLDETDDVSLEKLCRSTAGAYAFSCIEREFPGCEHIAKSLCRCPDQTQWTDKQGCILLGKDGSPVAVTPSDLKRGWYYGLPNEKRLDTPVNWVWMEGGQKSRWLTPSPQASD